MMYKWGQPVATLPSDGGDYTSLSLNDVYSAKHHPFPGHEPTMMPGFDPNHLAHQQPHIVEELPGFDRSQQLDHSRPPEYFLIFSMYEWLVRRCSPDDSLLTVVRRAREACQTMLS
eukprot:2988991-Pleurochrysis_carterae.AAC.1